MRARYGAARLRPKTREQARITTEHLNCLPGGAPYRFVVTRRPRSHLFSRMSRLTRLMARPIITGAYDLGIAPGTAATRFVGGDDFLRRNVKTAGSRGRALVQAALKCRRVRSQRIWSLLCFEDARGPGGGRWQR